MLKVCLPWRDEETGDFYRRDPTDNAIVYFRSCGYHWHIRYTTLTLAHSDMWAYKDEAKKAADAELVAQGWWLL